MINKPEKKKISLRYHYVCYGGSTVMAEDSWGEEVVLKCAGHSGFLLCKTCSGKLLGIKELSKWQLEDSAHNKGLKEMEAYYQQDIKENHIRKDSLSKQKLWEIITKIDYLTEDYEYRGDALDYSPNEREKTLMDDYAQGLLEEVVEVIIKSIRRK